MEKSEEVDVYCWQELPMDKKGKTFRLEGYVMICGVGGIGGGRDEELDGKGVVGMSVHDKWKGLMGVIEREKRRIGIWLDVGGGKRLEVWDVYVEQEQHERFKWREGEGEVVVMGDVNARSERWGGDGVRSDRGGRCIEDWMDEWGYRVGMGRGEVTRISERAGEKDSSIDIGVGRGMIDMKGRIRSGAIGMDHKVLEMEVSMVEWTVKKEEKEMGIVDWGKVEEGLKLMEWKRWEKELEKCDRRGLEEVVEEVEGCLEELIKKNRSSRNWRYGKKRWWNKELEEERKKVRKLEKEWEKGNREGGREELMEGRKRWKEKVEKAKGEYWYKYIEGIGVNEAYKWIKTDRDFIVDLPRIRDEEGRWYDEDEGKGRAIVRELGKREEKEQEMEEGEWDIGEKIEEEEVEQVIKKQKERKAPGENGLSGKIMKLWWKEEKGRRTLMRMYERSLRLGYVCERWRRSVGVVMRKPNKPDYSLPSSYRVINLLDVVGKGLERVVVGRLEKWIQKGTGDEQFGARKGRSSMEAVGKLYRCWEEGGRKGVLLCMDVKGGYENVGVGKMDKRLRELGVDMYLRKWISSFLREREVRVRIGGREGGRVKMKGGTVQGSPLSPVLFMFLLGGVLEKVRKKGVEGVNMVAVVDDVDFMVVGKDEEEVRERVGEMGKVLEEGLKEWEIDVQVLKLEGVWMEKGGRDVERKIEWMGMEVGMKWSTRVLGVWFQGDGEWSSHVRERIRIAEIRWRMMWKLMGKRGRGLGVDKLKRLYKAVVEKSLMYGMELYWDGQMKMKEKLQKWMNSGMRKILGAGMTTPVDAMLGELGWKRVEYELDKKVERWGGRITRKGIGSEYGEEWKKREEKGRNWENSWVGRMLRAVRKNKLEGERWEIEAEREGRVGWKIWNGKDKKEGIRRWIGGREEREEGAVSGISDASKEENGRIGIGGMWWRKKENKRRWSKGLDWGWTVAEGEAWGVSEVLERIEKQYKGEKRKLVLGTDNRGVLEWLKKGKGMCGEAERKIRRIGKRMIEEGWELFLEWVPGHVGIEENEEVDELAKEGVWGEVLEEGKDVCSGAEWESRRKKRERKEWERYWREERKGEEYFGVGGKGELGHGGRRWVSRMLVWLRTNHGGMRGARYRVENRKCECGEEEDRDHIILRCGKWWKERGVWGGWYGGNWEGVGWIEMDKLLFGERGVKKLEKFGEMIGWKEREWEWGSWKGERARKGRILVEKMRGMGGYLLGMTEEEREEVRKEARERMRRKGRSKLVQGTTPIASVVTGASRLTKRMVEDGWGRNGKGEIVIGGEDKLVKSKRKVLGVVDGNCNKVRKVRGRKE